MLKQVRKAIIDNLWRIYHDTTPHIGLIESALKQKQVTNLALDHFAIIDLPGSRTGIPVLKKIFSMLGFNMRGCGYLADKQNDFTWLAEIDSEENLARDVLPQIVVADFRPQEMPDDIRTIIAHYAAQSKPAPLAQIQSLVSLVAANNETAAKKLVNVICEYLTGRDWALPTVAEFNRVQAFNELLAWVLVFGRRPNHFTVSVHLLEHFDSLNEFLDFVEQDVKLSLNHEGGVIKGDKNAGIAQGSTAGITQIIQLADGTVNLPTGFIEFVWRYPETQTPPLRWNDYFTGFIAQHANHVIESLYSDA